MVRKEREGENGSGAKGLAKDLEVAVADPIHCHFSFPPLPYHV